MANRLSSASTASWTYDNNNQLTAAGTITYTFDANGNTTNQTDSANAANTRNYVYDIDNRLIEVRNSSNTLIAAYSYDPFGRRLSKDVGASKTYYFYNAEGLIAEADATGVLTKSYGYAPNSTFSTNPLWMKTGAAYYTYQNDHLGTPMKLLNQSGAVVWSATYDAFGKATVNPTSTITNNLRFPGQYADAETGLHYNGERYYDPQVGRYITSDPIGLKGGINTYTYTNNPLSEIDPFGLMGRASGAVGGPHTNNGPRFPGSSCGPEGDPKNYPNNFGAGNFNKACEKHDACYDTCGANKLMCDLKIGINIIASTRGGVFALAIQTGVGIDYTAAVIIGGQKAYEDAQKKACANKPCSAGTNK